MQLKSFHKSHEQEIHKAFEEINGVKSRWVELDGKKHSITTKIINQLQNEDEYLVLSKQEKGQLYGPIYDESKSIKYTKVTETDFITFFKFESVNVFQEIGVSDEDFSAAVDSLESYCIRKNISLDQAKKEYQNKSIQGYGRVVSLGWIKSNKFKEDYIEQFSAIPIGGFVNSEKANIGGKKYVSVSKKLEEIFDAERITYRNLTIRPQQTKKR